MDLADGELFRTSEIVVCDNCRCSASIFKLTWPGFGSGLTFGIRQFVTELKQGVKGFSRDQIAQPEARATRRRAFSPARAY
jgi:hypothetical protein